MKRCKGRIEKALISVDEKYPVLLPKNHEYTKLVILKVHETVIHGGVRDTLVALRQNYWVPHGRRVVKSIIRNCVICRKVTGKPYMGHNPPPLPAFRTAKGLPFQYTGVDLAGPLMVKTRKGKMMKSYISAFLHVLLSVLCIWRLLKMHP